MSTNYYYTKGEEVARQFHVYDEEAVARMTFLKKVYGLFLLSLLFAAGGVFFGLQPSVLKFVIQNPWIMFILWIAASFGVHAIRKVPGVNVVGLMGYGFIGGIVVTPLIYIALYSLGIKEGQTIILQALTMTGVTFAGLSGYVFITKKDFSFLQGTLVTVLFIMLGIGLVSIFIPFSQGMYLIISFVGVALFSGFILYDTSVVLKHWREGDAIYHAINLYVDFLILFIHILRILLILANSRR